MKMIEKTLNKVTSMIMARSIDIGRKQLNALKYKHGKITFNIDEVMR